MVNERKVTELKTGPQNVDYFLGEAKVFVKHFR